MLRSLEVTEVPYSVFFLCSPGDETMIDVCRATGHTTWVMEWQAGRADFAKKINWGYAHTEQPWIFTGADDLRFHPGWDSEALAAGARVVGTNDLHSPAVQTGKYATHFLFARTYIEERGGTFDGSGAVFSEAYDHQFIDNEFTETAKARGEWVHAHGAVVEHLHPVWGKAEWDDTYRKAFRETDADHKIFNSRWKGIRRAR